jgi:hypothetical protein
VFFFATYEPMTNKEIDAFPFLYFSADPLAGIFNSSIAQKDLSPSTDTTASAPLVSGHPKCLYFLERLLRRKRSSGASFVTGTDLMGPEQLEARSFGSEY